MVVAAILAATLISAIAATTLVTAKSTDALAAAAPSELWSWATLQQFSSVVRNLPLPGRAGGADDNLREAIENARKLRGDVKQFHLFLQAIKAEVSVQVSTQRGWSTEELTALAFYVYQATFWTGGQNPQALADAFCYDSLEDPLLVSVARDWVDYQDRLAQRDAARSADSGEASSSRSQAPQPPLPTRRGSGPTLHERLAARQLREFEAGGGGNCFFHSVLHATSQLPINYRILPMTHLELRVAAVAWLRQRRDRYRDQLESHTFVRGPELASKRLPVTVDAYLKYLACDGVDADGMLVLAVAEHLRLNIYVHSGGNTRGTDHDRTIPTSQLGAATIQIVHVPEWHYRSTAARQAPGAAASNASGPNAATQPRVARFDDAARAQASELHKQLDKSTLEKSLQKPSLPNIKAVAAAVAWLSKPSIYSRDSLGQKAAARDFGSGEDLLKLLGYLPHMRSLSTTAPPPMGPLGLSSRPGIAACHLEAPATELAAEHRRRRASGDKGKGILDSVRVLLSLRLVLSGLDFATAMRSHGSKHHGSHSLWSLDSSRKRNAVRSITLGFHAILTERGLLPSPCACEACAHFPRLASGLLPPLALDMSAPEQEQPSTSAAALEHELPSSCSLPDADLAERVKKRRDELQLSGVQVGAPRAQLALRLVLAGQPPERAAPRGQLSTAASRLAVARVMRALHAVLTADGTLPPSCACTACAQYPRPADGLLPPLAFDMAALEQELLQAAPAAPVASASSTNTLAFTPAAQAHASQLAEMLVRFGVRAGDCARTVETPLNAPPSWPDALSLPCHNAGRHAHAAPPLGRCGCRPRGPAQRPVPQCQRRC